jgi:hypothetical protein
MYVLLKPQFSLSFEGIIEKRVGSFTDQKKGESERYVILLQLQERACCGAFGL